MSCVASSVACIVRAARDRQRVAMSVAMPVDQCRRARARATSSGVSSVSCGSGMSSGCRPKMTRWNIHIMYQAAKITTEKVMRATHLLYWKVAERHQELADEAGHARQADAGKHEDAEQHRIDRHPRGESAERRDQPRVRPLVDHADAEEEPAGVESMRQHHHHRAVEAVQVVLDALNAVPATRSAFRPERHEDAERDEAHVADRRIGDQLLHVRLHERDQRAVDDGDHREDDDHQTPSPRTLPGRAAG